MTAKAPERDLYPLLRPYFSAWLIDSAADRYLSSGVASSPIWMASADPTAELNPTTGAALPPGSMVSGTDGLLYVANSSGVPTVQPTLAGANTWSAEQTFGAGAAFLDNDAATWGTGDDLAIVHNGTNTLVTSATGNLVIDNTSVTGHTYLDLGTDTSATSWAVRNNSGTALLEVDGVGTATLHDGTTLLCKGAGSGTGDVIEVVGPDLTHGMKTVVFEATVSPAAIETALLTLPANSCVDACQANIESALTGGGTTTTVSIGITGDVDAYGTMFSGGAQADRLTKNAKLNSIGIPASPPQPGSDIGKFAPAAVSIKLIAAATGGTTAGNTALTVGSVKVRIQYRTLMSIADAP
ncbi:MAG: hypothetical protein ACEQSX_16285 [Baekduiaceae bacterium]